MDTIDFLGLTQMGFFDVLDDDFFKNEFGITVSEPEQQNSVVPAVDHAPLTSTTSASTSNDTTHQLDQLTEKRKPTFVDITEEDKENFIGQMRNKNTVRKTESTLRQFQRWLQEPPRTETRLIWEIMPAELDNYLGLFLLSIRKADGSEYEPDTLTSYHRGVDRSLRENKYPYNIIADKEFATSRAVLASKRKELKGKGKGNRPNAAEPISKSERDILKEKGLLGTDTPERVINTVWMNNTVLFGIRGGTENRSLRWADIKLKKTDAGREYLEYNERLTKTRTCEKTTETRAFPPKQFSHENQDSCPVFAYKEFKRHRPMSMLADESPFYLAINHLRVDGNNVWFKCQPMGQNYLNGLMKSMAEKAGLQGRKTNHSARKTTCTKLLHGGVAPTTIQQLTGHKNVQSVNNYATASLEMQEEMSDILSDNPNKHKTTIARQTSSLAVATRSPSAIAAPTQSSIANHMSEVISTNTFSGQILQNARLLNCNITINHYDKSPQKNKRRRIRVIDSDSD